MHIPFRAMTITKLCLVFLRQWAFALDSVVPDYTEKGTVEKHGVPIFLWNFLHVQHGEQGS